MLATGQWWLASQVPLLGLVALWWATALRSSSADRWILGLGGLALLLERLGPVVTVLNGGLPPEGAGWSEPIGWTVLGALLWRRRTRVLSLGGVLLAAWAWMLAAWVPVVVLPEGRRQDRLALVTLFAAASWATTGFLETAAVVGRLGLSMDVTTLITHVLLQLATILGWGTVLVALRRQPTTQSVPRTQPSPWRRRSSPTR
jgi:hypothetical protein